MGHWQSFLVWHRSLTASPSAGDPGTKQEQGRRAVLGGVFVRRWRLHDFLQAALRLGRFCCLIRYKIILDPGGDKQRQECELWHGAHCGRCVREANANSDMLCFKVCARFVSLPSQVDFDRGYDGAAVSDQDEMI